MRTLVSYLNERSPQELRLIAERWQANQSEHLYPGQTFELSQEMSSEFLQRRLLEKLGPSELQVLGFFITQPNYTGSKAELIIGLNLTEVAAAAQITLLSQTGLIFPDKLRDATAPTISVPKVWGNTRFRAELAPGKSVLVFPRELAKPLRRLMGEKLTPDTSKTKLKPSQLPLRQLLEGLEPEEVESQAETWGLVAMLGSHDIKEIADELARVLAEQEMQNRIIGQLDLEAQRLFFRLREKNTTISALLNEYVSLTRLGRSLRPLTERLLVWEAFENDQSVVFVPAEIRQPHLSARARTEVALQSVTEPTQGITPYPSYALAWDALTFLNYMGQNEVVLTSQHYIPKRHVAKIIKLLWQPERADSEDRYNFLQNLCERQQLYLKDDDQRVLPASAGLNEWLKLDFYAQMRILFEDWLERPSYSGPVQYPYYYNARQVIIKANQSMLGWLRQCQAEVWFSLDSLLNKIQLEDPFFIFSRRDLVNRFGLKQVEEMTRQWNKVEAEIISKTFGSVFEWLGIVQISRDALNHVEAFRLTDFGAEMVGQPAAPVQTVPVVAKPLLVQPNFEVLLLSPQVETLWTLLKFSFQRKLDLVSIFAIDRLSVLRGLELGFTTTAMLEWLTANNPQSLPQNIQVSVRDWGKDFKRVTVEQTVLVETEDPKVLDELMQSKKYAEYFVRRLSPTAAIVKLPTSQTSIYGVAPRTDPLKTFRSLLKAGGFFAR